MSRRDLYRYQPPPVCTQVCMTAAERLRQDQQVAWLRVAIAARERPALARLDAASLRLPRPNEAGVSTP